MAVVTRIAEQKRSPDRRNVHLDGRFAFGCHVNVVAKFALREGLSLTGEQIDAIQQGEVRQDCLDTALDHLSRRLHSRAELAKKLARKEFGELVVNEVLADLERMGYLDDARFAKAKALSAAEHRKHGQRRAMVDLLKSGVPNSVARRAIEDVYEATDSLAIARQLAQKQAPRLRKLDPVTARRRLTGMLLRRGFLFDQIQPVLEEVLGQSDDDGAALE